VQQLSPPFQRLTLSPELSGEQLAKTIARSRPGLGASEVAPELELLVQGSLEVMVTEDCIPCLAKGKAVSENFWGLQDFKRVFPLRLDGDSRTHIFNSAETCLLDYMPKLFEMGLDGIAMDARGRTGKYAREMTDIYIRAIELTEKGGDSLPGELQALKERIRPMALGGITSGHFIRGLKEDLSR
jgi:putative protease